VDWCAVLAEVRLQKLPGDRVQYLVLVSDRWPEDIRLTSRAKGPPQARGCLIWVWRFQRGRCVRCGNCRVYERLVRETSGRNSTFTTKLFFSTAK
jgi:hypothetical protein